MSVADTDVLVHPTASGSPRARAALARLKAQGPVAITRQVLREYVATTTRPQTWSRPLTVAQAIADADALARRFTVLEDGPAAWVQLVALARNVAFGGKQVHDANMVATMLAHGETQLLTFNAADFRRFHPSTLAVVP